MEPGRPAGFIERRCQSKRPRSRCVPPQAAAKGSRNEHRYLGRQEVELSMGMGQGHNAR
jgi:hypothetical protein